jgi:hypothetical protein
MRVEIVLGVAPRLAPAPPLVGAEAMSYLIKSCQLFRDQLRRAVGDEPQGARLRIELRSFVAIGTIPALILEYDCRDPAAIAYMAAVDGKRLDKWDDVSCHTIAN